MLDRLDKRILTELQTDAGLSNLELSRRVGLSPSPCLARVRRLEADGVIVRRVALLDPAKVGATLSVFVQVALEKQTQKRLEEFQKAILGFPEVMECYLMTGDSDYLLRVVVSDTAALQHFIVNKLAKMTSVSNIRSSFALQQVKYKTAYPLDVLISAPD